MNNEAMKQYAAALGGAGSIEVGLSRPTKAIGVE